MEVLISALVLGLMGSFHCVGMCGPIAIALPLRGNTFLQKLFGGMLYNVGRTITYGVMGLVFGLLGQGIEMLGFQRWVSIIMGVLMIVSVIFPSLFKNQGDLNQSMFSFVGKLKRTLRKMFRVKSYKGLFIIGLLNGLLPCGLVYIAIAGAIGTSDAVLSTLFMILFGLGTLPMLLGVSLAGNLLSLSLRNKMNKAIPVIVVVVGLVFILRGLSLGIPFLSPPQEKIERKFEHELKKNSFIWQDISSENISINT